MACVSAEWESFLSRKPHVLGRYHADGAPYMPFRDLRNTVQTTIQRVQCLPQDRKKQTWHTSHKTIHCPQELDFFPKQVRGGSDCNFSHFANLAILKNVNLKAGNHLANLTDSPTFMRQCDGTWSATTCVIHLFKTVLCSWVLVSLWVRNSLWVQSDCRYKLNQ